MLAKEGVQRIEGAHCYAFYAGLDAFDGMMEEELGTFFLTDYLVRFFDRLVWEGLGLDRHPELMADYFGHYRRVVWLTQAADGVLRKKAQAAAKRLGLPLVEHFTGLTGIEEFLGSAARAAPTLRGSTS